MRIIHLLAVMAIVVACIGCTSKTAAPVEGYVVTVLQKDKPTSAYEYLLKGQVKTLVIRSYKPSLENGKVVKGAANFNISPYTGATKSCDITFKKDGSIAECLYVYKYRDMSMTKKETFEYKNGLCVHSTGHDPYVNWNYDYTYEDGRIKTFGGVEEVCMGGGTYSYPSKDTIRISYGDHLFSTEMYEVIHNGRVVEHHEVQAPNEPTEPYIRHYTFTYNEQGDIIKEILVKTGEIKGKEVRTFEYTYDKQGNWLTCVMHKDGKAKSVVERDIKYF